MVKRISTSLVLLLLCVFSLHAQQYLSVSETTPIATDFTATSIGSGGSCTAGAHSWAVSIVTPDGETGLSNGATTTCLLNDLIQLQNIPLGSPYATARNVYQTKVGTTTPYFFAATISNNTSTTLNLGVADSTLTVQARTAVATLPAKPMWQLLNGFFLPVFDNNPLQTIGNPTRRASLGGGTLARFGSGTTNYGVATGVTDFSNITSGTTQNTFYILNSTFVAANSLDNTSRGLSCDTWAQSANNANAKDFAFLFGGTATVTATGVTASLATVHGRLVCLRTAAAAQNCVGTIEVGSGLTPTVTGIASYTTPDSSGTLLSFRSQNTAAAAASGTGLGMVCTFIQ